MKPQFVKKKEREIEWKRKTNGMFRNMFLIYRLNKNVICYKKVPNHTLYNMRSKRRKWWRVSWKWRMLTSLGNNPHSRLVFTRYRLVFNYQGITVQQIQWYKNANHWNTTSNGVRCSHHDRSNESFSSSACRCM